MTGRQQDEYTALRATVRERGTARVCIFVIGVIAWAALAAAAAALNAPPIGVLVPLVVLAATFEAVFALHVGVERVGRYLQVFFDDQWEQVIMEFGAPKDAPRSDALFSAVFALAAILNTMPAALAGPTREEIMFVGGAHALFLLRVVVARRFASKQRGIDLERFRQLKKPD